MEAYISSWRLLRPMPTPEGSFRASERKEYYALVCWLRRNPDVAKSYGIKKVHGDTSCGDMLSQLLEAMGMDVTWAERTPAVPADMIGPDGKDMRVQNDIMASWILKATKRPGARAKQLCQRPQVAPRNWAAILQKRGRAPRLSFPLLMELAKMRRRKLFTHCGNRVMPPASVALVEARPNSTPSPAPSSAVLNIAISPPAWHKMSCTVCA